MSAQVCKVFNAFLYELIQNHYLMMSYFFYKATFSVFASFKRREGFKMRFKKILNGSH